MIFILYFSFNYCPNDTLFCNHEFLSLKKKISQLKNEYFSYLKIRFAINNIQKESAL